MTNEYTPRRSVLYMPSSNARALEKAKTLPVDALILDLEDAVGPDDKPAAREAACAAVTSGEYGERELTIRINGIGTQWHDEDLAAGHGEVDVAQGRPVAVAEGGLTQDEDRFTRWGCGHEQDCPFTRVLRLERMTET